MNFLDKLYESNYFGIGLFAVISFLVVTFLIVLFFGKRDEKRRLESTKELQKNPYHMLSRFYHASDCCKFCAAAVFKIPQRVRYFARQDCFNFHRFLYYTNSD